MYIHDLLAVSFTMAAPALPSLLLRRLSNPVASSTNVVLRSLRDTLFVPRKFQDETNVVKTSEKTSKEKNNYEEKHIAQRQRMVNTGAILSNADPKELFAEAAEMRKAEKEKEKESQPSSKRRLREQLQKRQEKKFKKAKGI